jgi:cyanophycinase
MLHGGGSITSDSFDRFIELAGGREARIVLVPSAGYSRSSYESEKEFSDALKRRFSAWLRLASRAHISSFEFLCTDNPEDANNPKFLRPLTTATAVWFSGGAQTRLNYRYVGEYPKKTRFQMALRDVLVRGGVVGGTSAGMAALPEIMTITQGRQRGEGPVSVIAAHGLGLFNGAIVEQHFDGRNGRLERFTGLLRDSTRLDRLAGRNGAGARMLGLAVEEGTALVLQDGRLQTLGAGNSQVFIKSADDRTVVWHTLRPGEKARLQRDSSRNVSLVTSR